MLLVSAASLQSKNFPVFSDLEKHNSRCLPPRNKGILPVYFTREPLVMETVALTSPKGILTNPTFHIPIEHVTKDCRRKGFNGTCHSTCIKHL